MLIQLLARSGEIKPLAEKRLHWPDDELPQDVSVFSHCPKHMWKEIQVSYEEKNALITWRTKQNIAQLPFRFAPNKICLPT